MGTLQLRRFVAWGRLTMRVRIGHERHAAISDLLDRALKKGVVLWGEATISLAGVDLIYVGLKGAGVVCRDGATDAQHTRERFGAARRAGFMTMLYVYGLVDTPSLDGTPLKRA